MEDNVLLRMSLCVEGEDTPFVGRITADNPFTDPSLILLQLNEMRKVKADYSYCRETPKGTAADLWTIECFQSTVKNASTQYELEHVNAWVWNNPDLNKILWFAPPDSYLDQNKLNLSIDNEEEFRAVSRYSTFLKNPLKASTADLIKLTI